MKKIILMSIITLGIILYLVNSSKQNIESAITDNNKTTIYLATPNYIPKYSKPYYDVFERVYDNINIEFTDYSGYYNDTEQLREFNRKLNLDFLSTKQADVIDISKLKYNSYIDKNYLLELDTYITNDERFFIEHYYKGIMEGIRYNDKYYYLPRRITPLVFYVNQDILNNLNISNDDYYISWEQLKIVNNSIGQVDVNSHVFTGTDLYALVNNIVYTNIGKIDPSSIDFDLDELVPLLEDIKELNEDSQTFVHPYTSFLSPSNPLNPSILLVTNNRLTPDNYCLYKDIMNTDNITYTRTPGTSEDEELYPVMIDEAYAISSFTENKEAAWTYLRYLSRYRTVVKIGTIKEAEIMANQKMNEAELKMKYTQFKAPYYKNGELITSMSKEQFDYMVEYYNRSNLPVMFDYQLKELVNEEISNYMRNIITPQELVNNLESKLAIYYNE